MFKRQSTILLVTVGVVQWLANSNCNQLQPKFHSLAFIHRHGDRTPINPPKSDPLTANVSTEWPDGLGQLTLAGKRRMYNLGLYLREKYQSQLSFSPREIAILSSGFDRCIESAMMVSSGMYRPTGRWIWQSRIDWQPLIVRIDDMVSSEIKNALITLVIRVTR